LSPFVCDLHASAVSYWLDNSCIVLCDCTRGRHFATLETVMTQLSGGVLFRLCWSLRASFQLFVFIFLRISLSFPTHSNWSWCCKLVPRCCIWLCNTPYQSLLFTHKE